MQSVIACGINMIFFVRSLLGNDVWLGLACFHPGPVMADGSDVDLPPDDDGMPIAQLMGLSALRLFNDFVS